MEDVDVNEPSLPRLKRDSEATDPSTPKEFYHRSYYEAVDLLVNAISKRFEEPGYQIYKKAEDLILNATRGLPYRAEFDAVIEFYGDDFNASQLEVQLEVMSSYFTYATDDRSVVSLKEVCEHLKENASEEVEESVDYSQVTALVALVLVMPPTDATCDESLSALRRIRDYPKELMEPAYLERLMLLHVNTEITKQLNLEQLFAEEL